MIYHATIAIEPHAKERPRFGAGRCYNSKKYTDWRKRFVALAPKAKRPLRGSLDMTVLFATKTGKMRPDLDNALAGVADALQDAGIIENDRDITSLYCCVDRATDMAGISITIEEKE